MNNPNPPRSEWSLLRQLVRDMSDLKKSVADLREERVRPEQIYTREVMDQMIKDVRDEVNGIKEMLKEDRQNLIKILGLGGTGVTVLLSIIVFVAQHVTFH
jgi:hypothetical protein